VQSKRILRNGRNFKTTDQQMRASVKEDFPQILDIEIDSGA
jgi:hypothetical protein